MRYSTVCDKILNSHRNKWRSVSCPTLFTIQGILGKRPNWPTYSRTKNSSVLVHEYTLRNRTAKYCAGVFQGTRHAARIS